MRDTSKLAFNQLKHIGNKQQDVLIQIHIHPDSTDKQIAQYLNWPINCITNRRGELEKKGLVVSSGVVVQNGRKAHIWKVTPVPNKKVKE